jgi:methionyl-tRNA formyltransferase
MLCGNLCEAEARMKILFITHDDPIYVFPFFDEFFQQSHSGIDVVGILSCETMGNRGRVQLFRELFNLYGAVGLLRLIGRAGRSKIMSHMPAGRRQKHFYSLTQICRSLRIHHGYIGNPNREKHLSQISALSPDLIVSVACPYRLKQELLTLPPRGCINIHHGPLPRYKGMMPTFWQMFHGEPRVGLTIHAMDEQLDGGKILLREYHEILGGETLDALIRRTKRLGAHRLAIVLEQIAANRQTAQRTEDEDTSYFGFPTLVEIKEFLRRGLRAI